MDELDFLKQADVRAFVRDNEHADVQKLVLNPPKAFKEHIRLIADQIISTRKLKNKLPEWVVSDAILPPPVSAEQASSHETAFYKASILNGDHLVDLTGGSGVDIMALGRKFRATVYVDPDPWLCKLFRYNQSVLSQNQAEIHQSSAEVYLDQYSGKSVFYIDPSRRLNKNKVFLLEDCQPNIAELLPILRDKGIEALIKLSPMLDIKEGIKQLGYVKAVHIVSVKNECKEILFHLDFQSQPKNPQVICINLNVDNQQPFDFTYDQEQLAEATYAEPQHFLYDPNTSILKAGAFNLIADTYQLHKISPNTHLYTSLHLNDHFPGRCFEVLEADIKSDEINNIIPRGQVNVITKNYPLNSDALKKKLKVKDGGDDYLLGFRDQKNISRLVLCKRIY